MPLRPYQQEFKRNLAVELNKYRSVIGCGATGFGKTKVFIDIADGYRSKDSCNSVLILTESSKIWGQISREMAGRIIDINADTTDDIFIPENSICIAMSQTLIRRPILLQRLKSFKGNLLCVIDECHVGTPNNTIRELSEAKKIGFSATPDARWAKHLPEFYRSIVVGPQPEELVRLGFLSPYKHFARVSADIGNLTVKGGEFTEESQEKAFGTAKVFDGLAEDLRTMKYKKCLIFCASINDCEMEYERLTGAGFSCVRVHSKLSKEDESLQLGQFMRGDVPICISVGTLTKGFDFPMIDLIVLRRATTSLPLYLQMCGRGSRTWNEHCEGFVPGTHEEKMGWTTLDYGQNFLRFGLWDMDRDWHDLWDKPSKQRDGVAPVKLCPRCEYIMMNSASVCPNCGFEFIKSVKELEPGKLIEITEKYSRLCGKNLSKLKPDELAIYANFKNKKSFAGRIAKGIDQEERGYLEKYGEAMGYKASWPEFMRKTIEKGSDGQPIKVTFPDFVLK